MISGGKIKIRCLRLVLKAINTNTHEDAIKDVLSEIVRQTYGQFNEGDINEWSEIFQKVLTVKRILKEKVLSLPKVIELLNEVEKYGERYSFYWIQRGIAAQKNQEFDLAAHYFNEGIRIRPNSYQAHHALAKNLMERGVEQAKRGDFSYAAFYMDEGIKEMKDIINNPAYSRGYKYSLHALIDMSIKYFGIIKRKIDINSIQYINEKILLLSAKDIDTYILGIIRQFVLYCRDNGYDSLVEPILKRYENLVDVHEVKEEEYLVENLDWDE